MMESKDGEEPVQARSKKAEFIKDLEHLRNTHELLGHEWKITEVFAPDTQSTKWMTLACPCGTFVIVPAVELK